MIMKKWKPASIFPSISRPRLGWAGGLLLLACAGNVPEPGENHLRYAEKHGYSTTLEDLREGRALVLRKCEGCHSLYRMNRITPEKWPQVMDSMRVEAKLSPRQD